jgi:hypothetical protein
MERVMLALADRWHRPAVAEVLVHERRVEFRYGGGVAGAARREVVRDWLTCPGLPLVMEGVSLSEVGAGVAIAIDAAMGVPEVPAFVLPDHVVADLREVV